MGVILSVARRSATGYRQASVIFSGLATVRRKENAISWIFRGLDEKSC
jgi:hypothetical protein